MGAGSFIDRRSGISVESEFTAPAVFGYEEGIGYMVGNFYMGPEALCARLGDVLVSPGGALEGLLPGKGVHILNF